MDNVESVQLTSVADIRQPCLLGELCAFNIGPDQLIYIVVAVDKTDLASRIVGWFSPQPPTRHYVAAINAQAIQQDFWVEDERMQIHDVQPLKSGDFLLVCGRTQFRGPDNFDRNGRVYHSDGQLRRDMLLGDGIQSVQTTSGGVIWTSYYDEGIFGSRGWETPVGADGLVAWNASGEKVFSFQAGEDLNRISDCYAMNVVSDAETWIYYYTDFPLVRIRQHELAGAWSIPLAGSYAFAVSDSIALFSDGYERRNRYHLFQLGETFSDVQPVGSVKLLREDGHEIIAEAITGRGDSLWILADYQVYRLSVRQALQQV